MIFYWQKEGGHFTWQPALVAARDKILESSPQFTTVLALSQEITDENKRDAQATVRYAGPLYFDFDSPSLEVGIRQVNLFLDRLESEGVDLAMLHLYATGGRGFHVEVPPEMLCPKQPKGGFLYLPQIYKEVAHDLYVETMDMRVYSAGRGRMWRVPNVKRDNGKYKVAVSPREVREMTVEMYDRLCSEPRTVVSEAVYDEKDERQVRAPKEPSLCNYLAVKFATAVFDVPKLFKQRAKNQLKSAQVIAKFNGQFPPTMQSIMQGEGLKEDAGWNKITLQVAIMANQLGKDHDEVVAACEPLIESHRGNSDRYGTPAKRRDWLRFQLQYTQDNLKFEYAVAPIRDLLTDGTSCADLDGVTDPAELADHTAAAQEKAAAVEAGLETVFDGGVTVGKSGIMQQADGEWKRLSMVGFDDVTQLINLEDGLPIGFDADLYYCGSKVRRAMITLECFSSRVKLHSYASATTSGVFQGTDAAAGYVQEVLNRKARVNKKPREYVTRREGLDIVQFPANIDVPEEARKPFPIFATADGCEVPQRIKELNLDFRFLGVGKDNRGQFNTDIGFAPDIKRGDPLVSEYFKNLFEMNNPRPIAVMLGWYAAAHARMFFHRLHSAFPVCQVTGQAAAGKSTTIGILQHMHFYRVENPNLQCQGTSEYAWRQWTSAGASLPVYMDDYKQTLDQAKLISLQATLRGAYDLGMQSRGAGTKAAGSGVYELTTQRISSPILFHAEVPEVMTAIEERQVIAYFMSANRKKAPKDFCEKHAGDVLAPIGRAILWTLLNSELEDVRTAFEPDYDAMYAAYYSEGNYRPTLNYAMTRFGWTLMQRVLESHDIDISEQVDEAKQQILRGGKVDGIKTSRVQSEPSKFFKTLVLMSRLGDEMRGDKMVEGHDYAFSEVEGQEFLELNLPYAYSKYQTWCRSKGQPLLYPSEQSLMTGLMNYSPFADMSPTTMQTPETARFKLQDLQKDQIGEFKRTHRS